MDDHHSLLAVAIMCLTVLEIAALQAGIDGQVFLSVIATIAGLAGYHAGRIRKNPVPWED